MRLWRGRLVFQQYIKNKHQELCTPDGLVFTIEAYGGQGLNDENNLG